MSRRRMIGSGGLQWIAMSAIAAAVLVLLAAIGLVIYGGMIEPPHHHYEQVLSNDRLPL